MGKGLEYTPKNTYGQHACEKMFNVTNIREMQIKSTMNYQIPPLGWPLKNKTNKKTSVGEIRTHVALLV